LKKNAISISVQDLKKKLGSNQALKSVSTDFGEGMMHGLIGPEGAGKTTLFRHLVGLLKADEGVISYYSGQEKQSLSQIRSQIAYMPQQQSLYADLSIDEHLLFFKAMYVLSDSEYREKKDRLLNITRLEKFADRPAGKLSGGMYKKLGLMCALMSSPQVLILDEPTNGVDPISRREFWDLLYQLRDENILIIVATAYMDEAERCSKVHLLSEGCMIGSGDPIQLLQQKGVKNFDEFFLTTEEFEL
jgi:ABC-2 type transport system ATP-binding protein